MEQSLCTKHTLVPASTPYKLISDRYFHIITYSCDNGIPVSIEIQGDQRAEMTENFFSAKSKKQPFAEVLRSRCFLKFREIHRKTPVQASFFTELQAACKFILKKDSGAGAFL